MPEQPTQTIESVGNNLLREIPDHEGYFETPINGLTVINRPVYSDERGSFSEVYNARMREEIMNITGISFTAAQANLSVSAPEVGRGLHFEPEHKLISIASGNILGIWVDLRVDSQTKGTIYIKHISPGESVFIPSGIANGFYCLPGEEVKYFYLVSELYSDLPAGSGQALSLFDPDVIDAISSQLDGTGLTWPPEGMIISDRDKEGLTLHGAYAHNMHLERVMRINNENEA